MLESALAFLLQDWLGQPVFMWLAFIALIIGLLWLDLGVFHFLEGEGVKYWCLR